MYVVDIVHASALVRSIDSFALRCLACLNIGTLVSKLYPKGATKYRFESAHKWFAHAMLNGGFFQVSP